MQMDMYVSGGCVSMIRYEDRLRGRTVKAELELGGGQQYVDDLSLRVEVDGQKDHPEIHRRPRLPGRRLYRQDHSAGGDGAAVL